MRAFVKANRAVDGHGDDVGVAHRAVVRVQRAPRKN